MKMRSNTKGQMRVIETILASFILVAAINFINIFAVTPRSSTYEAGDLEKMGYNALHDLDEQRLLSRFVYSPAEWPTNFTVALRVSLPSDVYFDLAIYDLDDNLLNDNIPIRYGDPNVFAKSSSVASVTYFIAGHSSFDPTTGSQVIYDPRTLILLLVRG